MITNVTTSYEGTTSELIDLLIKRDQEIADLKSTNKHLYQQWDDLQDWLQVLLKAYEYYREAVYDAMECIDADEPINAYDILDRALHNNEYLIEWKNWKPENDKTKS